MLCSDSHPKAQSDPVSSSQQAQGIPGCVLGWKGRGSQGGIFAQREVTALPKQFISLQKSIYAVNRAWPCLAGGAWDSGAQAAPLKLLHSKHILSLLFASDTKIFPPFFPMSSCHSLPVTLLLFQLSRIYKGNTKKGIWGCKNMLCVLGTACKW